MKKGQYSITLVHEQKLVRVIAEGELSIEQGEQLISSAREKAAEHGYNIICDVRASRAKAKLADWFFLPRRLGVYKNFKTRNTRTALIVSAGRQEENYRFFEMVASNIGLNIRVFLREKDALEWLR